MESKYYKISSYCVKVLLTLLMFHAALNDKVVTREEIIDLIKVTSTLEE